MGRPSTPQSELVGDTLSFEEHRDLDRRIQQQIVPWNKGADEVHRADMHLLILIKVVRGYHVLDSKYADEAQTFLKDNPWLQSVLDKCWEKGEYCMIR